MSKKEKVVDREERELGAQRKFCSVSSPTKKQSLSVRKANLKKIYEKDKALREKAKKSGVLFEKNEVFFVPLTKKVICGWDIYKGYREITKNFPANEILKQRKFQAKQKWVKLSDVVVCLKELEKKKIKDYEINSNIPIDKKPVEFVAWFDVVKIFGSVNKK